MRFLFFTVKFFNIFLYLVIMCKNCPETMDGSPREDVVTLIKGQRHFS